MLERDESGVSPVIGVVLMVAITVALAAVVAIVVTSSGDRLNEGSANAKVEFESSSAGLVMKVEQISTDADVLLNGDKIDTISKDSAGKKILIPTKPGDKIVLASGNRESTVLVTKTVEDRSEVGDLIAYWKFDDDSDTSTLKDYSGNDNDATLVSGSPTWGEDEDGTYVEFNPSGGTAFNNNNLNAPTTVDEFTFAVSFKIDDNANSRMDAWEHNAGTELGLETWPDASSNTHVTAAKYGKVTGGGNSKVPQTAPSNPSYPSDEIVTYIVTLEQNGDVAVYRNGEKYASRGSTGGMNLNEINIGSENGADRFDGKIYDLRMYYTALDDAGVKRLDSSMP